MLLLLLVLTGGTDSSSEPTFHVRVGHAPVASHKPNINGSRWARWAGYAVDLWDTYAVELRSINTTSNTNYNHFRSVIP